MSADNEQLHAEFQKLSEELRDLQTSIIADLSEGKITPAEAKARQRELRPREQALKQRLADAKKAARE